MARRSNALSAKLGFDEHHRMERFGVMVCIFVLLLGLLVFVSVRKHIEHQHVTLTTQAKYTNKTVFSKTGENVTVIDVYRDNSCTKAFILLQVDNMDKLSINADDYKMYMTGYNGAKLTGIKPIAAVYVFGLQGYIGLYLSNPVGFDSQLYNITLRNSNPMVVLDPEVTFGDYGDQSFEVYNQCQLVVNFAGTDAPTADFLNKDSFTMTEMYTTLLSTTKQDEIKADCDLQLTDMNTAIAAISKWEYALTSAGCEVPALPISIACDSMTITEEDTIDNPMYHSSEMDGFVVDSYVPLIYVNNNDLKDGAKLYFKTNYVFAGGLQYNHQNIGIQDKFIDTVLPMDSLGNPLMSYDEWKMNLDIALADKVVVGHDPSDKHINHMFNYFKNGIELSVTDIARNEELNRAVSNFEISVQNYINLKYGYQTELLRRMVDVKYTNSVAANRFTVNANDNVLIVY